MKHFLYTSYIYIYIYLDIDIDIWREKDKSSKEEGCGGKWGESEEIEFPGGIEEISC